MNTATNPFNFTANCVRHVCPHTGVRYVPFESAEQLSVHITLYGRHNPRTPDGQHAVATRAQQEKLKSGDRDIELRCTYGRVAFRRGDRRFMLNRDGSVFMEYKLEA